jgi:tRNA dimethylallyltransferase
MKTLLVIAGPTAVGKTALAIGVAERLGTSVISSDSRQCYREMSIGTAKPTPEELTRVKHYFVDCFSVQEEVTAGRFETLALGYLDEIFEHAGVAVCCGGTGLYIRALCEGLDEMPRIDTTIERAVEEGYSSGGTGWLQARMQEEDPRFFAEAEWQNPARLMRALSFVRATGQSILQFHSRTIKPRPFRVVKVGLELPRNVLYDRINQRVMGMMEAGLLEEAHALYPLRHLRPLQTVGYAELFDYFDGKLSLEEAVDKIKQHTRNYAKRQLTWFRKEVGITWIDAASHNISARIADLVA